MSTYKKKLVLFGAFTEVIEYEKPVTFNVQGREKFQKRIYDPFKPRRVDNLFATKRLFVRRVLCAFEELGQPLWITLTYKQGHSDLALGYKDFREFILRLRQKFSPVEAIAVPEFHKSGTIHYHVLLFGLPQFWGDKKRGRITVEYGFERESRTLAGLWKQGFLDCVQTFGDEAFAFYVSKYMTKAVQSVLLGRHKAYYMTRGIPQPLTFYDDQVDFILSSGKARTQISEHKNRSIWLGNLIKKRYVLTNRNVHDSRS